MRYDTTIKELLLDRPELLLRLLVGEQVKVSRVLTTELPKVENLRPDLLFELVDDRIVHLELQAQPVIFFGHRMLGYRQRIWEAYRRVPLQIVLWLGKGPVRVADGISEPGLNYSYPVVNLQEVDTTVLLESPFLEDNLLGMLGKLVDYRPALAKLLRRIAEMEPRKKQSWLAKLVILSGLRGLVPAVKEEIDRMPIEIDIMENEWLAEIFHQGEAKGLEQGMVKGRTDSARGILARQLEKRFGPLPAELTLKIEAADLETLERWSLRLIDSKTAQETLEQS
ncbi:MAG: hypothetical protein IT165_00930 [Bryobacterales bacterium]|nr:hypothetical protein [Bryobacterales bacterium]